MSDATRDVAPADEHTSKDASFQMIDWRAQGIARVIFRGLVLAALFGVLGTGPVARTSRDAAWGTIHYDRFLRTKCRVVLNIHPRDEVTRIDLGDLFGAQDELTIVPPPLEQGVSNTHRWIIVHSRDEPTTITIHWKPNGAGLRRGTLTIDDASARLWSFVYP